MDQSSDANIFINGKAQIIEMLQIMPPIEREKLLNNIKVRNPNLALELMEESFTFKDICNLGDPNLQILFQYVQAPILGIALKDLPENIQRKILTLVPRNYAEEAFKLLTSPLPNEKRDINRAQNKILSTINDLRKRKLI